MAIKPMLFNAEMVQAILDGRKTVTRRPVKFKAGWNPKFTGYIPDGDVLYGSNNIPSAKAPYKAGDVLWVRETWRIQSAHRFEADVKIEYKSGGPMEKVKFKCRSDYDRFIWNQPIGEGKWKPSIHMPKEAARIFLRVTDVRAKRLQDMSIGDILNEGFVNSGELLAELSEAKERFCRVWNSSIKPAYRPTYGWEANPWTWVIEFERCEKPGGWPC